LRGAVCNYSPVASANEHMRIKLVFFLSACILPITAQSPQPTTVSCCRGALCTQQRRVQLHLRTRRSNKASILGACLRRQLCRVRLLVGLQVGAGMCVLVGGREEGGVNVC